MEARGNSRAWRPHVAGVAAREQAFRDKNITDRMIQQSTLSDYFWTHIYNNPDIDKETLDSLMPSMGGRVKGADNTMQGMLGDQQNAFKYLWARWKYCKRDERLCWWFIFWDDFWKNNFEMDLISDHAAKLGPSTPSSIMYNCMPKEDLKKYLKGLGLYHENNEEHSYCCGLRSTKGIMFFPSLIDRMYDSMTFSKGTFQRELTPEAKEAIKQ